MMIEYCDICHKPLADEKFTRYKLKERVWLGGDSFCWVRLSIHDRCWRSMCDFFSALEEDRRVREEREKE